jgi:hypothetical protein
MRARLRLKLSEVVSSIGFLWRRCLRASDAVAEVRELRRRGDAVFTILASGDLPTGEEDLQLLRATEPSVYWICRMVLGERHPATLWGKMIHAGLLEADGHFDQLKLSEPRSSPRSPASARTLLFSVSDTPATSRLVWPTTAKLQWPGRSKKR